MPNLITRVMPNPRPNPESRNEPANAELELIEQPYPLRSVYWCHQINEPFMLSVGEALTHRFSNDEERLIPIECPHCNWAENVLAVSKPSERHLLFYVPSWWISRHTLRAMFSMLVTHVVSGPPEAEFPVVRVVQRVDFDTIGRPDRPPVTMPDVTADITAEYNHDTKKLELKRPAS